MQLVEENLALRKQRERAEPAYYLNQIDYGDGEGFELRAYFRELDAMKSKDDFGGVVIPAYTAPPAPVVPKIDRKAICNKAHWLCARSPGATFYNAAEFALDEVMELLAPPAPVVPEEMPKPDTSKMFVADAVAAISRAEGWNACRAAMLQPAQAETDTTAQQVESLAGKAVVPAGWKLVPVELTKEMLKQIHPFAEATCLDCGNQVVADCVDNVTASWNDMLAVAPEPQK